MSFYFSRTAAAIFAALALPNLSWAALPDSEKKLIQDYESVGSKGSLPPQSLIAVARAYRDAMQWDKALALFQEGERRFPSRTEFALGRIMTLADARRIPDAVAAGQKLAKRQPRNPDSYLALGYAYQMGRQPYAELDQDTKAYSLAPGKAYVVRSYIQALQNAGVPAGVCQNAEDRCDNDPQLRHLKWLTEVTGTKIGTWPVYELPMKLSRTPAYIGGPINRGAPGYGEDNAWLLTELLGMTQSDVQRLAEDGVI